MSNGGVIENSAKALIIQNGTILLVRYEDTSDLKLGVWYSLPGGRQHYGETIEEALIRECKEEIAAEVTLERLLFIREYIHSRHDLRDRGRDQHKVELMFLCSLDSELGRGTCDDVDQRAIEWVPLEKLSQLQIFPTRLRELAGILEEESAPSYWGDLY